MFNLKTKQNIRLLCILFFGIVFFITADISFAAPGDYAIYRDTNNTFDTNVTSWTGVPYNNQENQDSIFTQNANDIDVDLGEAGHYLGLYTVHVENTGYNARSQIIGQITVGGTAVPVGFSEGYGRNTNNDSFTLNGVGIINAALNDDIRIEVQEVSSNTPTGMTIDSSQSSLTLLKLDDYWDYIRLSKTSSGNDFLLTTSYQTVGFDVQDEYDSGTFTHSTSTNTDDIILKTAGHYMVAYTVNSRTTTGADRATVNTRITLDGIPVEHSYGYGFSRFDNSTTYAPVSHIFFIEAAADDVLNVEGVGGLSTALDQAYVQNDNTALTIVKLPDTADFLRVHESTTIQSFGDDVTLNDIVGHDSEDEEDTDSFSHDTGTNRIAINDAANYLFTFGARTYKSDTANVRNIGGVDWYKNAVQHFMGRAMSYIRGNQGTDLTYDGGVQSVILFESLIATDVIDIRETNYGEDGGDTDQFQNDQHGITASNIDSWFEASVSTTGTQITSVDVSTTDNESGGIFVITDITGERNVTGITITEEGTVDAQNDLDNIELYYELDTSAPYDCASESYAGSETQFGATDTNGFSGANGTSTFTGSVTINIVSTMCVYVVYDVGSASDSETIEITIDDPSTDVTVNAGRVITTSSVAMAGTTTISSGGGALSVDIVDSGGSPVTSPSVGMGDVEFSFSDQTATGSLGISAEKIRVDNGTGTATWTVSIAAAGGSTDFWNGTIDYDFNDSTANAGDGGDADSLGGEMTVDPSSITITPEGGCSTTNISAGSSGAFEEGVTDSVTIASAAAGADTGCFWDITGIDISQTIPLEQGADNYSIDMTLSIIAS